MKAILGNQANKFERRIKSAMMAKNGTPMRRIKRIGTDYWEDFFLNTEYTE